MVILYILVYFFWDFCSVVIFVVCVVDVFIVLISVFLKLVFLSVCMFVIVVLLGE